MQIWSHNNNLKLKIQSIQNKVLKIIHFKTKSAKLLFKQSNILRVCDYVAILICLFVYDFLNNKLPNVFDEFILPANESHQHWTRFSKNNMTLPYFYTTAYGKKSVTCHCINEWNSMQTHLKKISGHCQNHNWNTPFLNIS